MFYSCRGSKSTSAMAIVDTSDNPASCLSKSNLCKSVGFSFPLAIVVLGFSLAVVKTIWISISSVGSGVYCRDVGSIDSRNNMFYSCCRSKSTSAMAIVNTSDNPSCCLSKSNLCKSVGLSFPLAIVDSIRIPSIDTSMRYNTIGMGRVDTSGYWESTNSFNTSFSSIGDYPDIVKATIKKSVFDRQTSFNLGNCVWLSIPRNSSNGQTYNESSHPAVCSNRRPINVD